MNDRDAAINTLTKLGYTYRGGEQWVPPLGKPPNWSLIDQLNHRIDDLTAQLAETKQFKMAKAIDDFCDAKQSKLLDAEARHIVTRFRAILGALRYKDDAEGAYFMVRNARMMKRCDNFILATKPTVEVGYRPGDVHPSTKS